MERQRNARVARAERRVERLIEELAVEAEIARERQDDVIVFEPREPVDYETKRDPIDAGCGRSADRKGEGAEHSRQHHLLAGRDDAVLGDPVDADARAGEVRRVAGDREVDLRGAAALPRQEAGVAVVDGVARQRPRCEGRRRPLIREGAVERKRRGRGRDVRGDGDEPGGHHSENQRQGEDTHKRTKESPQRELVHRQDE